MSGYQIRKDSVEWRVVDGEAVVIHLENSDYFGLNPVGTWLWQSMVSMPRTTDAAAGALVAHFAIDPGQASRDVEAFFDQLDKASLVAIGVEPGHDLSASPQAIDAAVPDDAYEAPTLVKFGDLDTLILSAE